MMKKLVALILALVMVMAMGSVAFAADPASLTDGVASAENNVVKIQKSLIFKNPSETSVYGPNITYTYTVTPGSAGKSITDVNGVHATTYAGLNNATVSGSVTWDSNTKYAASASGVASVKDFSISFNESSYEHAGVYRYEINEAVEPSTKADAGVDEGTISGTRYLDVYVKNGATANTYTIYGYALFSKDNAINGTATDGTDTVGKAGKTTGFVPGDETGDGTVETADTYETINLIVSKTLSGDDGMKGNQFPFTVTITNTGVKTAVQLITKAGTLSDVEAGSSTEGTTINIAAATSGMTTTDANRGIKDADAVKYIGVPALGTASYSVYETNNVTGTTYTSTYSVDGAVAAGEKKIEKDVVSETATIINAGTTDHKVVFTNTLDLISPTGVVLRVAPYVLILAAGMVLMLISRRRKAEEE